MKYVVLIHVGSTLAMVGVIWFAQIVHYPLFAWAGTAKFPDYQANNLRRTGLLLGPFLSIEGITAVLILVKLPAGILPIQAWIGISFLVVIWVSTILLQVPCHKTLANGFDAKTHRLLVHTNWIRTIAWSARGILVLWMVDSMH